MRRYLFLISQPAAAMTLACGPLLHLIHQVVIRLSCHWATSHAMIVLAVAPARHAFAPLCSLRPADHDVYVSYERAPPIAAQCTNATGPILEPAHCGAVCRCSLSDHRMITSSRPQPTAGAVVVGNQIDFELARASLVG